MEGQHTHLNEENKKNRFVELERNTSGKRSEHQIWSKQKPHERKKESAFNYKWKVTACASHARN